MTLDEALAKLAELERDNAALSEKFEQGRQWNNLLELELSNLRSLKPTCYVCEQLMEPKGEDGTDFFCVSCDRCYKESQAQLRLCEQHAGTMAKDFDASIAVVQADRDQWKRRAEALEAEAKERIARYIEQQRQSIAALLAAQAHAVKLREAGGDALIPIATILIGNQSEPYEELGPNLIQSLQAAPDGLMRALPSKPADALREHDLALADKLVDAVSDELMNPRFASVFRDSWQASETRRALEGEGQ